MLFKEKQFNCVFWYVDPYRIFSILIISFHTFMGFLISFISSLLSSLDFFITIPLALFFLLKDWCGSHPINFIFWKIFWFFFLVILYFSITTFLVENFFESLNQTIWNKHSKNAFWSYHILINVALKINFRELGLEFTINPKIIDWVKFRLKISY